MGYSVLTCIMGLCFITFSCGSNSKKTITKTSKNAVGQSGVKKDSIITPSLMPPPKLAPEVTRIKGKVISIVPFKDDKGGLIKFKVLKFLGMGSSAAAVTTEDTLTVHSVKLPLELKKNTVSVVEITFEKMLRQKNNNKTGHWELLGLKKINDKN